MQETQVQSLIQEDPTCYGATKTMSHNYWACDLEPESHNHWSPRTLERVLHNKSSLSNEKPALQWESSPHLLQL